MTDTPFPTRQGVLGITRMILAVPNHSASLATGTPATIETTVALALRAAAHSRAAPAACCGLTARKTRAAPFTASAEDDAKRIPGTRWLSRSQAAGSGSWTVIAEAETRPARQNPSASASAICPPPTIAIGPIGGCFSVGMLIGFPPQSRPAARRGDRARSRRDQGATPTTGWPSVPHPGWRSTSGACRRGRRPGGRRHRRGR